MTDSPDAMAPGMPPEQLAALSHELRTPLSGVMGMTRLLESTSLSAEQKAYVSALAESGEHLLGLVNDVLDYARLGAGAVRLATRPIDAEGLLRQVAELMAPRAREKGIEIAWAVAPGTPAISGDETRLRQILLNYASNAVKFVETGGALITAEPRPEGRVRFCVSDTGPGVPSSVRGHVFEAFAQLDQPEGTAPPPGAGLGLAIVRRIATAMDGEVGVEEAEGGGARFWFEAALATASAPEREKPLEGIVVGVVSPSPIVRTGTILAIEGSGGRVVAAQSLALLVEGADVMLIDHACAQPPALARAPLQTKTLVLLDAEDRGRIGEYRRAGFCGYLIKPLRRDSLIQRVLAARDAGAETAFAPDDRLAAPADPPVRTAIAGARVLLAEDNPINAMLAGAMLRKQGCHVDEVADGDAAVAAASARPYDLILMDLKMPLMDGMEATRALRTRGIDTPVVALTASALDDDRAACLAAGMDDFLVKPLGPEGLAAAVSLWTGPGWTAERRRGKLAS